MRLYLDSAYVAKLYVPEPDSARVRALAAQAEVLCSSAWCLAEVSCAVHRHLREGKLTLHTASEILQVFFDHVSQEGWKLVSITDTILRAVAASLTSVPANTLLRAGDAVHLVSARDAGFSEIWSNDRQLLRAAPYFGLTGRSV